MELVALGVLLLFALAIIMLATRGLFARDLTRALKRVNQREQEIQEKADILEQRLNQMERDYQAKLKYAAAEAERIIQEAKGQAMNLRTVATEEAKHRARQLLLEAEQGRMQLKAELAKELNGQAIQHACAALRTLLPPSQLASLHATLMGELLDSLGQVDVEPFRASVGSVEVRTAQPLAAAESDRLTQWLAGSVGPGIPVHVETDPVLVAGGVVSVGPTIMDNSLPTRLGRR